jgi:anti-sigma regulatory factor (Ser/Thr protein kinase)
MESGKALGMSAEVAARARRRSLLRLRPVKASARSARAAIDDVLAGDELREARFRARLLATELVTNSVLHAGLGPQDRLELRVDLFADHVRVDVTDEGCWREGQGSTPPPDGSSGRGLILVGALADRWGIVKNGTTRVWFELDLGPIR